MNRQSLSLVTALGVVAVVVTASCGTSRSSRGVAPPESAQGPEESRAEHRTGAGGAGGPSGAAAGTVAVTPVAVAVVPPRHSDVVAAMKRAVDYYRPSYSVATGVRNGWSWSTYFDGVHQLYRTAGDTAYVSQAMNWGASNNWAIDNREESGNQIKAAQTYLDLNRIDASASLTAADARMARDLRSLPTASWTWIDSLFMGMPSMARWAGRTGDDAYLAKMHAMYEWIRDDGVSWTSQCAGKAPGLYDAAERLWYRDCTYKDSRDQAGKKVFWSRGNGWVMAALAEVLQQLPAGDSHAASYRELLATMAERIRGLQGTDGMWRSSLLNPALYPDAETSGTALFTYAMAYGVNAGILDRATYVPVIARAWQGLTTISLRATGFLSNTQNVAGGPGKPYVGNAPRTPASSSSPGTLHTDSPPFGVGAFLLAGSEVAKLTAALSAGRSVQATAQQEGNEARQAVDGDVTTRWSALDFPQSLTIDLGVPRRVSNSLLVPHQDRAYRYTVEVSADGGAWTRVVDRGANTATGSRPDAFAGGAVTARYVRLTVTGLAGAATRWISVQEFSVHDRFLPGTDVAQGRPATATTSQPAYPAERAVDGVAATFWVSGALPTTAVPQDLTVDLGGDTAIDQVRVLSRVGYGPRAVAVLTSGDELTWTTIATATLPDTEGPHTFVVPRTTARWLRLRATSAYSPSNVQVAGLEAYDSAAG